MSKVLNFSRHPLNTDQRKALEQAGFEFDPAPISPFFKDGEDFLAKVKGQTVCAVVPSHILLEAMSLLTRPGKVGGGGFTLLTWEADQAARKRGRFATTGLVQTSVWAGPACDQCWGEGNNTLQVNTQHIAQFAPTVENDFSTGEEYALSPEGVTVV